MTSLQRQFEGFLKTHFLWRNNDFKTLQQINLQCKYTKPFNLLLSKKFRLGKLVERFVSEELSQCNSIQILAENIQIQNNTTTIGEIDCLLLKNKKPIHLEIVYKFYLYDYSAGNSEIEHWIGPNRRDSFIQKLTKLKQKQLPLLYHEKTKPYLDELNLSAKNIKQLVYFKAQLFVPLKDFGKKFNIINNNCVEGFYIYQEELTLFSDCKFYIPTKHNWLVKPYTIVNWMNFDNFKKEILIYLFEKNSPLCWLKKTNGEMVKFFVVYW